jgi:hypothetical protein
VQKHTRLDYSKDFRKQEAKEGEESKRNTEKDEQKQENEE